MKKNILIVFTGGTISMEKHSHRDGVIIASNQNALLDNLKRELSNIDLTSITFSMKPSPSMKIDDLFNLAKLIESEVSNSHYDGIVITHGTDTMEESAYFLDLYFNHFIPIVFTGSMRNFSQLGYDGLSNLVSAILVAASNNTKHRGVLVVMNDEINAASEVTKSHTLALDTFKSLEFGPIGIIDDEQVIYYRNTKLSNISLKPTGAVSAIEIVKTYLGSTSFLMDLLIDHKVEGIVIEALGRGNVPPEMMPSIKRAISKNIPVILTSRAPMGRVLDTYGYEGGGIDLVHSGVILAPNLNSQKARIKLLMVMGMTRDLKKIKSYFEEV